MPDPDADMGEPEFSGAPRPGRRPDRRRPERARDVAIVVMGGMGVLALLALSGALGWVEAVTACIVLATGSAAYYVGTTSVLPDAQEEGDGAGTAPAEADVDFVAFVASLPFPALHVGRDGRIDGANPAAREVFRMREPRGALAGAVVRDPPLLAAIERTLTGKTAERVEIERTGASDQVWLAHVGPLNLPAGGVLVVLEDRTEARRAEQARADFLANASHELRTPLTSLAGFIETMRGPARDDKASWDRFLDIMFEQTERMRRLIADLLSLSRIEFSEHRPPETETDLAVTLSRSVQALRPVAAERDIEINYEGPETGLTAIADADEMMQVAQNLLVNAVKYSPDGGAIRVSAGRSQNMDLARDRAGRVWDDANRMAILSAPYDPGAAGLWFRVSDEGPGIDREHLPRLGQRFYRVDSSRGGAVTGTGLGLAIVKHIMARHRGGLIVESLPGRGSAFGIWCPAASSHARPATSAGTPGPEIEPVSRR